LAEEFRLTHIRAGDSRAVACRSSGQSKLSVTSLQSAARRICSSGLSPTSARTVPRRSSRYGRAAVPSAAGSSSVARSRAPASIPRLSHPRHAVNTRSIALASIQAEEQRPLVAVSPLCVVLLSLRGSLIPMGWHQKLDRKADETLAPRHLPSRQRLSLCFRYGRPRHLPRSSRRTCFSFTPRILPIWTTLPGHRPKAFIASGGLPRGWQAGSMCG